MCSVNGHSITDGEIETLPKVQTIADGIAVKTPGDLTFELTQKYVDGIVTVSDDEIALAIFNTYGAAEAYQRGCWSCACGCCYERQNP